MENVSLLVLAIVQGEDAGGLIEELERRGFGAERIDSRGGFLIEDNAVVLVGAGDGQLDGVLDALSRTCHMRVAWAPTMLADDPRPVVGLPVQIEVGGAVVFVLEVERCVRLGGATQREATLAA